jgi:hypothetical protein
VRQEREMVVGPSLSVAGYIRLFVPRAMRQIRVDRCTIEIVLFRSSYSGLT